jgi:hypothetical protein
MFNTFDPSVTEWLRLPRLNKTKGMLSVVVNHLTDLNDSSIKQKIQTLGSMETEIYTIISTNATDLDKKNSILNLMDGPIYPIPTEKCCVCKNDICLDIDFCEKKNLNWLGI